MRRRSGVLSAYEGRADGWFLVPEKHPFRSVEWGPKEPETSHHLKITVSPNRSKRKYSTQTKQAQFGQGGSFN
jgi:hypothetical protein